MEPLEAWTRRLRRRGLSVRTVQAYRSDVERLIDHIGHDDLAVIDADAIDEFLLAAARAGLADATLLRRYRAFASLFEYLERTRRVEVNPMRAVTRPALGDLPAGTDARHLAALLGACTGGREFGVRAARRDFESARDTAIVLMLMTTGARTSELVAITTADVDDAVATVAVGSGTRRRVVELLPVARASLAGYLSVRGAHPAASDRALWLGLRGAFTDSGLRQMLERRSAEGGARPVRPRDLRHAWVVNALRHGASVDDVMALGGWRSGPTVRRYVAECEQGAS